MLSQSQTQKWQSEPGMGYSIALSCAFDSAGFEQRSSKLHPVNTTYMAPSP